MRALCGATLFALVMVAGPAWAQQSSDAPPDPTTDGGDVQTVRTHEEVVVTDTYEPNARIGRVSDKKFWIVGAALNTAMLLDTMSTFDVLSRCNTCYEANPYAAPFVNRGPAVAFTAGQLFDIGVMTVAGKMKTSKKPQLRKIWWVVPVALTAGHLVAYHHNRNLLK